MAHGDAHHEAVPGVAPAEEDDSSATRLEVDGEVFDLRPAADGGAHYTWVNGPNPGYGFSISPAPNTVDEHRAHIQGFLAMIDPITGYIGEA
jgi:hypothetical protein